MKSLEERLEAEIEAVENDDTLTNEQKRKEVAALIREAKEMLREEQERG